MHLRLALPWFLVFWSRIEPVKMVFNVSSYRPIPMVFSKGEGSHIVDPEGDKYIDFLSAYSAVNQVRVLSW
jgi:acetylornithine/succinyldiaminopimelate/putrescine aminotransferase